MLIGWWSILPYPLFRTPYSTALLDKEGRIIGMSVASDQQFRLPEISALSPKYIISLITFEDQRFFTHQGVDFIALLRACWQNLSSHKIVSGGSTISMQVIRIARQNPVRTYSEKIWEIILALRLEHQYTKYQILQMYALHAPFAGNIVGIQTASQKYFDRSPEQLSWAEAAFLAILPNSPSLKKQRILKEKRDNLLKKLYQKGWLNEEDYVLAIAEPLPEKTSSQTSIAPHLMTEAVLTRKGQICCSTIDSHLQEQVNEIVNRHSRLLSQNHIYNMAVLVAYVPTGEVKAYVGNASPLPGSRGNEVNIIKSVRSSGSILKPALYAFMQQEGYILPATLIPDIPSRFGQYAPSNFNKTFQGVIPADRALAMSLNIPFVRMLKSYNYHRFYNDLKHIGITSLNRSADDYGLSLILGGAETSLWDLCNMYGGMSSTLNHYNEWDGQYFEGEYNRLMLWSNTNTGKKDLKPIKPEDAPLSAASIWLTLQALESVERPELESGWRNFVKSMNLSWKTGTSFGFRDAWAVGVNADWVIGVWVGNADGEGRPGLVGVRAAAPVLFEVAGLLPVTGKWHEPSDELEEIVVCKQSGYRASNLCERKDTVKVCRKGKRTELCPFHRLVHLDSAGRWQVNSECEPIFNIYSRSWFILPPVQEWYYTKSHTDYRRLPPYRQDCFSPEENMDIIYPPQGARVFIPQDFGGTKSRIVCELAHRRPETEVYWHIDNQYVGMTQYIHQLELNLSVGNHLLTLIDASGNTLQRRFQVVGKTKRASYRPL
ncbi:penicillin-binding protein 1C [Odoribacter lunatus]|uniref:penicillin-binding protein 1C n=1 Tax=Odoribacter lunatus TaxID=2941335 RepID=UPI00204151F6|nr:penicillin-binding protein 1C [Odoribacter lunatus]